MFSYLLYNRSETTTGSVTGFFPRVITVRGRTVESVNTHLFQLQRIEAFQDVTGVA